MGRNIYLFLTLPIPKLVCGRISLHKERCERAEEGIKPFLLHKKSIPYAKLMASAAVDSKPTKTPALPPTTSSSILIPYQEVFIKQDTILVHERSFIEEPAFSPKPTHHITTLNAFLDAHPDAKKPAAAPTPSPLSPSPIHSSHLDTHPYPNAYPNAHTTTQGQVFEDNVWSVVSKAYVIVLLVAIIAYFLA
jgi:hypothetical protein